MMKKILVPILLVLALVLTGCSNKSATTTTEQNLGEREISEVDPWLKSKGFVREQLTDPALYSYNKTSSLGGSFSSQESNLSALEQKKIGATSNFAKSTKLGLQGTAKITAYNKIAISSFSYNGSCGAIILALTMSNDAKRHLADLKTISTAISTDNGNFELTIPSNISLIQFDALSIFCPNDEKAVSTAPFK